MLNPTYHLNQMREVIKEFEPSPERDEASRHLDHVELMLSKCRPTAEAWQRDQMTVTDEVVQKREANMTSMQIPSRSVPITSQNQGPEEIVHGE